MVCYAVVQVVGCGYIINVMSGGHIPMWLAEILILIAVFSYVYSSGLASVGWVSIMQGLLMFVIAIIAAFYLCYKFTGDWTWFTTFEKIAEVSPAHLTLPGPTGTWTTAFWSTSILITTVSVWPNFWMAATGGKTEGGCTQGHHLGSAVSAGHDSYDGSGVRVYICHEELHRGYG